MKQETIVFALPGNEQLASSIAKKIEAEFGEAEIRSFPDGETFVRVDSDVQDKRVVMVCTLDRPDQKLLPLYFLSQTCKDLGADCTCLVAPYLAYMRQDSRFHAGEGVTSEYFAKMISGFADSLITVDPHLHRRSSLNEIYSIPTTVLHAANAIAAWIQENVENPVLIGPDSESEQWVSEVAEIASAPFEVLEKIRRGDKDVEVTVPNVAEYGNATPVLIDDIISTARTMAETVRHINAAGLKPPICVGVHGIFAGDAFHLLSEAGVEQVITCNTVKHLTNNIDLTAIISNEL